MLTSATTTRAPLGRSRSRATVSRPLPAVKRCYLNAPQPSAIGTLVERASGFAMLVALPDGYKPEHVAPALARKVQALRRSLT